MRVRFGVSSEAGRHRIAIAGDPCFKIRPRVQLVIAELHPSVMSVAGLHLVDGDLRNLRLRRTRHDGDPADAHDPHVLRDRVGTPGPDVLLRGDPLNRHTGDVFAVVSLDGDVIEIAVANGEVLDDEVRLVVDLDGRTRIVRRGLGVDHRSLPHTVGT